MKTMYVEVVEKVEELGGIVFRLVIHLNNING